MSRFLLNFAERKVKTVEKLTLAELRAWRPTQTQIDAAMTVFQAMAYVQTIRPEIKKMQEAVLKEVGAKNKRTGESVRDAENGYLMPDDQFEDYLKRIHEEYLKAGYTVSEFGECPLLVAENLERLARRALLEVMKPVTKIDPDEIYSLEHLKQLEELCLSLLAKFIEKTAPEIPGMA